MEKSKKELILRSVLILYFVLKSVFQFTNVDYYLRGWKHIKDTDRPIENIIVLESSGGLVLVRDNDKERLRNDSGRDMTEYIYYSKGISDLTAYQTYRLDRKTGPYGKICDFDQDKKLFSYWGGRILDLETGEIENVSEKFHSGWVFDCYTLNSGELLIAAEERLIIYDSKNWKYIDAPFLDTTFNIAEDHAGKIWIVTGDGDLITYDRETGDFLKHVNLLDYPEVIAVQQTDDQQYDFLRVADLEILPNGGILIQQNSDLSYLFFFDEEGGEVVKVAEDRLDYNYCEDYFVNHLTGQFLIAADQRGWAPGATKHYIYQYEEETYEQGLEPQRYFVPERADCLAVDPDHNILYIRTDSGVFYREIKD